MNKDGRLTGKVALVTGAARGIGRGDGRPVRRRGRPGRRGRHRSGGRGECGRRVGFGGHHLVVTIERGDDDVEHPHEVDWEVHIVVDLRTGGSAVLSPELGGDSTSMEPFGDGTYLAHGLFEEARHRLPEEFVEGRTGRDTRTTGPTTA